MRKTLVFVSATLLSAIFADTPSRAANLTYTDGICQHRVTYDATKVDGRQLQATFDYLAGTANPIELPPSFETAEEITALDIPAYHARCAAAHRRLADPAFVALPGLDDLRRHELVDLDTTCARTEAALAAAKGDVAPARAHAPACTRYTDLLALPAPALKAQWNDLVMDLCQASTVRNICAGELQRRGEGPGSEVRRRVAVVTRWSECAAGPELGGDGEKPKLLQQLARRYRAKAMSCAR